MKRKLLILALVSGLLLSAAIPAYAGSDAGGYKDSGLYRMYYCYKYNTGKWTESWALINGSGMYVVEYRPGYCAAANSPTVLRALIRNYNWAFQVHY
ncbi:MAG: hypothetical protein FWG40_05905 [Peptococcaceae bacterium]|nr:hypothetical protein [Peptococcaceae bacterium]